jgi:SAM-dependent methyltransferase
VDLRDRVNQLGWYHTLELAPGVVTAGMFDLRPHVQRYGLPDRLDGMRVLDVGTWDGFWAFEMERRGAAEVVALDLDDERELDWPPRRRPSTFPEGRRGDGFRLAKDVLGSKVQRVVCNIYDADPTELGTFDLVFCGMVLLHLRDQLRALERIARLCRGTFISAEEPDALTSLLPFSVARYRANRVSDVVFWLPNQRAWRRMMWTAGFDRVERYAHFKVRSTHGFSVRHVIHHARESAIAGQPAPGRAGVTEQRPVDLGSRVGSDVR